MAGEIKDRLPPLTQEQLKRRRTRSLAIAAGLTFLIILFYAITIIKMTPAGHGG